MKDFHLPLHSDFFNKQKPAEIICANCLYKLFLFGRTEKTRIFLPSEPLKSLENKGKTLDMCREILAKEKNKELQKSKERKIRAIERFSFAPTVSERFFKNWVVPAHKRL